MPTPRDDNPARTEAAQWLARRNNGDQGAQDQQAFLAWLNASDAHRRAYTEAETLWEVLRELDQVAERPLAQARSFLRHRRQSPMKRRVAMAASVVLATGGLWWADWHSHWQDVSYQTALGQRQTIDLPDGSRLELNTDSQALVHYSRHVREIRLVRGQAVFTVAQDHARPFDVMVGSGRVRDLSTQFEVRRWPAHTSVTVLDGAVEVAPWPSRELIRLSRGQRMDFTDAGLLFAPQAIDINSYAAWREGRIVFQNQPLREVLAELARYHSGSIAIGKPSLLEVRVSGSVPTDDLALALHTVAAALPARLRQVGPQAWQLEPR